MVTMPGTLGRRRLVLGLAAAATGAVVRHGAARADAGAGSIVLHSGDHWGHLTVTNTGPTPVLLQPNVQVEALSGGLWHALETEINLVAACDPDGVVRPLPDHIVLPVGASLTPPPWRGWSCNGQCERHCRNNVYWGAGPFRFRVVTSPAGRSFASEPFMMPKVPTRPDDSL